jgi:hypothetical protein
MIVVKPYGGLGNRIRSVDSAVAMAECTGKDLKVIWDSNEELNCPYSKLFEVPDNFELSEISSPYLPRKVKEKLWIGLHRLNVNFPFSYQSVLHEGDIKKLRKQGYDFCEQTKFKNILIWINGRFLFPDKPYHYLKPAPEIQAELDRVTRGFHNNTLGVHIRRTDNRLAIKNSPLEKFAELMQMEKEKDPEMNFFLSTDSKEAEEFIRQKFPGDVMSLEKELSRNSEEGIKAALIDMLSLSRTSKIIGSYYSSFSEVASEIGGITLEIAGRR